MRKSVRLDLRYTQHRDSNIGLISYASPHTSLLFLRSYPNGSGVLRDESVDIGDFVNLEECRDKYDSMYWSEVVKIVIAGAHEEETL